MAETYVIIGGGVAGLCAAIRLTELGIRPVLIESGDYPAHKICGEFFSPECLDVLRRWEIQTHEISKVHVSTPSKGLEFTFPMVAGGISHSIFDPLLVQRASAQGAKIYTNSTVSHLEPGGPQHRIELASGEVILATQLLIATGRIPVANRTIPSMHYKGIKAHFSGIPCQNSLEMFSFNGAYLGISPVSEGCCNVACLASMEEFNRYDSVEAFVAHLMTQNSRLHDYLSQGKNLFDGWMSTSVPAFGRKAALNWPNTYAIGDAAGTIPPATGYGLSMATSGGILAAEYAFKRDPEGFKQAWQDRFQAPIRWGKALHTAMLHPRMANGIISLAHLFPCLATQIFKHTR